jgi:hypothetical protein
MACICTSAAQPKGHDGNIRLKSRGVRPGSVNDLKLDASNILNTLKLLIVGDDANMMQQCAATQRKYK